MAPIVDPLPTAASRFGGFIERVGCVATYFQEEREENLMTHQGKLQKLNETIESDRVQIIVRGLYS